MKKAIESVVANFNTMRTGRANPAILDKIVVSAEPTRVERRRPRACMPSVPSPCLANAPSPPLPPSLPPAQVDYYGTPTPLKSLASIAVPDAATLLISPFDRSGLRDVEKAILESDLGINPSNDGEKIRLNMPPMTQDRRKELTKKASKMGEDGKVAVRNVRKDALKRLDKHEFPKDARKALDDSVQKLTDRFVKSLDDLVKAKSDELMKV